MELVTLKVFDNAIDAHILKCKLESEDIACFIFDEHLVTMNPLYNLAVGGIKLKINLHDVARAKSIIREIENLPYTNNQEEIICCPKCASEDLYSNFKSIKNFKGIMASLISFFFIVFPIYYKSVYKCKKCNFEFTVK
jgi:hypothetical protein